MTGEASLATSEAGETTAGTATGLPPNVAAALAYLGWWVTGAVFLVLEPANPFVRFHARQALTVLGLAWAAGLVLWMSSILAAFMWPAAFPTGLALAFAVWAAGVLVWAVCLVQAWRGRWWAVPGFRKPGPAERPIPN